MPDPAAAPPVALPKPLTYRCPNASYTITEAMCQGRQLNKYALCPRCTNRAPLPGPAPSPN